MSLPVAPARTSDRRIAFRGYQPRARPFTNCFIGDLAAQDQWSITPRLTLTYGIRYEYYPPPYKDHTGPYIVHTNLPQTGNVEIGGVNGNSESAFNVFNHPLLYGVNGGVPNNTVASSANVAAGNYGTLSTITSFGQPYSPTQGARTLQFSGRFNF